MFPSLIHYGISLPTGPHPTFRYPTISEVVCEIAFERASAQRISVSGLYELLRGSFPEIQSVGNMMVQIVLAQAPAPASPFASPGVPAPAFRFATSGGDEYVQVSENNFVYDATRPYPGWASVKDSILAAWETVAPVVLASRVTKIGLRYINRIAKDKGHPRLSDWLRATDDIPARLVGSHGHFFARIESSPAQAELKVVTLAQQVADASAPYGAILFDLDRVSIDARTTDQIPQGLEYLHDEIWDVFWPARTPALESKLKGE
jgi:uncharacterized protein (TIGR04255 family)